MLLELLGKKVASPEGAALLARYPELEPDSDEDEPGLGGDSVHYLKSEGDGLLIKVSGEGTILTIFLMSEGKDGFSQFQGPLPGSLRFSSTRREVVQAFGAPAYIRPAGRIGSFQQGELLRFDRPEHSVHILFKGTGEGIELVTLMLPSLVPGRSNAPSL